VKVNWIEFEKVLFKKDKNLLFHLVVFLYKYVIIIFLEKKSNKLNSGLI